MCYTFWRIGKRTDHGIRDHQLPLEWGPLLWLVWLYDFFYADPWIVFLNLALMTKWGRLTKGLSNGCCRYWMMCLHHKCKGCRVVNCKRRTWNLHGLLWKPTLCFPVMPLMVWTPPPCSFTNMQYTVDMVDLAQGCMIWSSSIFCLVSAMKGQY
jgi:hypothetical protein